LTKLSHMTEVRRQPPSLKISQETAAQHGAEKSHQTLTTGQGESRTSE